LSDEEYTVEADEVLKALIHHDFVAHVPRIFHYEVTSILARACASRNPAGKHRMTQEKAAACLRKLFYIPLLIYPTTEDECVDALTMATTYSKTAYDMTYLRLAQALDCVWCTADAKVTVGWPEDSLDLAARIILLPDFQITDQ